ncbi:MAG: hypothetical protein AAB425_00285 [Bdellovibrionota bacterium]
MEYLDSFLAYSIVLAAVFHLTKLRPRETVAGFLLKRGMVAWEFRVRNW